MSNANPVNQEPVPALFPVPTPLFRKQVLKASGLIILFFTAYTLLLVFTTALATACVAGGIMLLMSLQKVLAIIVALALVALGAMLLFFLGGAFFSRRKGARSHRTLLQPAEHPRLFHFITELSAATHTRFRGKVFAVPGVKAAVFHGSGQLEIGLGLVNSLNIGELKMMLGRTLGRFSLPGMQLGTYVSRLHQWIYHRLYESDGQHVITIRRLGRSYFLRPFSQATIGIANGMQYLLTELFALVNRAYIPVSREMEFYADAIGTQVAGSQAAVSALHRVEIGGHCMEHCLDELPVLEAAGRRFRNVYEVQRALIRHYALRNYLSTDAAGLPVITDTYLQAFVKSRVQFRRQGASQPSLDERTQRCRAIITTAPGETASAWELFNDQVRLQEDMTALQYNDPAAEAAYQWYPALSFITDLEQQEQPYTFPPAFNGYYDNRPFARLTPSWLLPLTDAEKARYTFETLYTPANTTRIKLLFRDRQDAETLQAIAGEQIPVDHFEFDGQTYPADQASGLLTALNAALAQEEAWLYEQDCFAFRFHYTQALEKGENQRKAMLQLYEKVVPHQERMQQMSEVVTRIVDCSSILLSSPQLRPEEMFAWLEMLDIAVDQFHEQLKGLFQYLHVIHTWDIKVQEDFLEFTKYRKHYHQDGFIPRIPEIRQLQDFSITLLEQYNNYVLTAGKAYLDLLLELSPEIIVHEY